MTRGPRRILAVAAFVAVGASGAFATACLAEYAGARRLLPPGRLVDIGGRRLHLFCAGSGRPTVAALAAAPLSGPFVLVAGSFGGVVAELFARERPSDVIGVVTLDALTTETANDPVVASLASKACAVRWAAEFGLLRLADPFRLAKASPVAFEVTYRASTDLPLTVVVHGEPRDLIPFARPEEERAADPAWLVAQRAFAGRSRHSRLVVATGSGHIIVEDRPDLVIETVQAMVDEVALLGNPERP